jgi:hypothetical protein
MKKLFAAILLACAPLLALANPLYFSPCDAGAHASCVVGSNANDGLTAANAKQYPSTNLDSYPTGTTLRFACGSRWNLPGILSASGTRQLTFNSYASPGGAPCTLDTSIGPDYIDAEFKPRLHAATNTYAFLFNGSGGQVFDNLRISSEGGGSGHGIFVSGSSNTATGLRYTNNRIDGFGGGFYTQTNTTGNKHSGYFAYNYITGADIGWQGCVSESIIEHNWFVANNVGSGGAFDHGIYFGCSTTAGPGSVNVVFRHNKLIGNSIDTADNLCKGGGFTVHGVTRNLLIEDNLVHNTASAGRSNTCGGIYVNHGYAAGSGAETFVNTRIRGNITINVARGVMFAGSVGGIIENHLHIEETAAAGAIGIDACSSVNAEDSPNSASVVRNSTIYFLAPHSNAVGIDCASLPSSQATFANNLIVFGTASGNNRCFNLSTATGETYLLYNNLCFGQNHWQSATYSSLASFETQFSIGAGDATGNLSSNPLLVGTPSNASPNNAHIQSTSPARDAGRVANCPRLAIYGYSRETACDIGAFEYGRNP